MRFLEYLFFKYYYFQVRVGNEDIAPFSAIVFIGFIMNFIVADVICFYFFFIPSASSHTLPGPYSLLYVLAVVILVLCFIFLYKKKYKKVLKIHENEWKGKKNIGAILFAVIPFLLFFAELFISIKINQ